MCSIEGGAHGRCTPDDRDRYYKSYETNSSVAGYTGSDCGPFIRIVDQEKGLFFVAATDRRLVTILSPISTRSSLHKL